MTNQQRYEEARRYCRENHISGWWDRTMTGWSFNPIYLENSQMHRLVDLATKVVRVADKDRSGNTVKTGDTHARFHFQLSASHAHDWKRASPLYEEQFREIETTCLPKSIASRRYQRCYCGKSRIASDDDVTLVEFYHDKRHGHPAGEVVYINLEGR